MRPFVRIAAAALVLSAALSTSACVTPSEPDPEPTPAATPLFASDDEALAAAEEAYGNYVEVTDQIFAEGGVGLERLEEVAIGRQLEVDQSELQSVADDQIHSVGATTFDDTILQRNDVEDETAVVTVYLCEDVSGIDVLDNNGVSVVLDSRPDQVRLEVEFRGDQRNSKSLLVQSREVWSGGGC